MGWQDCHLHDFEIGGHRYGAAVKRTATRRGSADVADTSLRAVRCRFACD
jgi:hypothetical protein